METAGVNSIAEIKTISNTHTQCVDTGSALCLPLQVKLSQLCEQDKILKELEVKISSLKEDKVEPSVVGLNQLTAASCWCLASTDLSPPPQPQPSTSRTSWRVCWTFPASRWSSTRSSQATPTRLPTSRGCCRRTWSPLGPRSPDAPRYHLAP